MNCIGICASTDDNMTQNYNKVISFNQKDKVFEKMLILMMNAVCNYKKINKKLPE